MTQAGAERPSPEPTAATGPDDGAALWAVREGAHAPVPMVLDRLGGRRTAVGRLADEATAVGIRYGRHRSSLYAGGLAFFVVLALVPTAIAFGSVAGLLLDPASLQQALDDLLDRLPDAAQAITPIAQQVIDVISSASDTAFGITTAISVLLAVYASSRFVYVTRVVLDVAFDVPPAESGIVQRLLAAVVTLVLMVAAAAALFALTFLPQILSALQVSVDPPTESSTVLQWVLALAVSYLVFRLIYRYGPHAHTEVGWVSPGALLASVWLLGATVGVGVYARFSGSLGTAIAVLGSTVVLLLWLYFIAIGLVLGAELEAVRDERSAGTAQRPSAG